MSGSLSFQGEVMKDLWEPDEKRDFVKKTLREYLHRNRYRAKKRKPERYFESYAFLYEAMESLAIRDVIKQIDEWHNQDPVDIVAGRYSWADDKLATCRETAINTMSMLSAYENALSDIVLYLREEVKEEEMRRWVCKSWQRAPGHH